MTEVERHDVRSAILTNRNVVLDVTAFLAPASH